MSIDYPLHTLDILGAEGDVTSKNCILRENKTNTVARGTLDYIVSLRDSILDSRGYKIPELWDHSWDIKVGPIWTPSEIGTHLETWICPEYFKGETNNPTRCIEATNRVDTNTSFEQTTLDNMPTLTEEAGLRHFDGLYMDGNRHYMRYSSNTSWYVGTDDFIMAVVVNVEDNNGLSPIIAKKNNNYFSLLYDSTGLTKDFVYYMNGNSHTITYTGSSSVITCGRRAGYPFLRVNGSSDYNALLQQDTTSLTTTWKGYLGDQHAWGSEFKGSIFDAIVVNDNLTGQDVVDLDLIWKIEGYLAHKYGLTSVLDSEHKYKNAAPRASVVK